MIQFLYGQDTYRSREELRKIIEENKKACLADRQANLNWLDFVRIDAADREIEVFEQIRQTTNTVSMFGSRKLIIIENIFLIDEELQESILEFLEKRNIDKNNDVIFIFWDEKANEKSKLFRFLKNKAKIKKFDLLKGIQLKNWIKKYIDEQGGKIESQVLDKLIEYIDKDLWRASNEINKLINYNKNIKTENVELLVRPEIDLNIFKTIDALAYKDKEKFLKLVNNHLEKGDSEGYLMDRFIYQIRNLIKVKAGGKLDMRYFVIQKSRDQAKNFSFEQLKKIYSQLLTIDFDIKTGRSNFMTGLELLVSNL